MDKNLKKQSFISIIISIVFAILGISIIIKPSESMNIISIIFGILFILIGVYKLINYYKSNKNLIYNYDNVYGIIDIIFGIIIILCRSEVNSIFRIMIGLWIIYSSLIKISLSFKFKRADIKIWIYLLLTSIIMGICGIFITLNSGSIMIAIEVIIIINSIIDIIEEIIFQKNIKEIKKLLM